MKTELKLVENQSGFRKYGICCKFGFIRTICAERGKSYANMSYYFQIHLRHLLAPFPRLRPLIPLSVALLRCVSFALASAKNSLRILAHSHLEIVSRERTQTSSVFIAHLSPTQRRTPVQKHNFVEKHIDKYPHGVYNRHTPRGYLITGGISPWIAAIISVKPAISIKSERRRK